MARGSDLVESMAIAGAIACMAHCIALPVLMAALPAIATVVPVPTTVHIVALIFAAPTTMLALVIGFRQHGVATPLLIGTAGLALLAIGVLHFGETPMEVPTTVAGSLLLAAAHIANWRHRRVAHAR